MESIGRKLMSSDEKMMLTELVNNHRDIIESWDNIKSRRRKELSMEKRERMAAGGGVYVPPKIDDGIDAIINTIDIEIPDSIDSDEISLSKNLKSGSYVLDDQNVLQPIETEQDTNQATLVYNRTESPLLQRPGNKNKKKALNTSRSSAVDKELEFYKINAISHIRTNINIDKDEVENIKAES
ncbi:hypothetical protein RN001_006174 [Aquatica leii]|uniref:Uncharacterized protein n=1 Tax=Aquatica leii TaxID=1421715 RepID=A0AAN7SS73_9COLE|nr:hypothetical protein RN001_006174 [Aquatica leii]